jgi:hypothetical protein
LKNAPDGNLDYREYPCTVIEPDAGGDWSWARRSGKIFIIPVPPTIASPSTQSSVDSLFNN